MIKKSEHITEGFEKLRKSVQKHNPFPRKTKRQILAELRHSREKLWKERMGKDKLIKNWDHLMEVARKTPSPFKGMTKQQVIKELRKTREKLWKERIASFRYK